MVADLEDLAELEALGVHTGDGGTTATPNPIAKPTPATEDSTAMAAQVCHSQATRPFLSARIS